VFALVNLPEVVKGALFARYSRSAKSLRRLFLDEFLTPGALETGTGSPAAAGTARAEQLYERIFVEYGDDSVAQLGGVHLALNVFVATSLLWIVIRKWAGLNPIWAISAMLASSDPHVNVALTHVRSRLINAVLGCAIGLAFLVLGGALGGSTDWRLPLALAATALISSYIVRVPVMWRQAPITAALVIASGIEHHSEKLSIEIGLRRVAEVLFGCLLGLAVSWLISKIWPLPQSAPKTEPVRP
jgi:uncharacterized membrane protein YccC